MPTSRPQQQPQVIFLDAVGTLFGVRGSVGQVYQTLAGQFGVKVEAAPLHQAFVESFRTAPKAVFPDIIAPELLQEQEFAWWRAIAAQSFDRVGALEQFADFETFFEKLYAYFATTAPWFIYPDVFPTLQAWQAQGIELGILSNFDTRLYQVLAVLDLAPFFNSVTLSTEVGVAKPDQGIFQAAIAKHQTTASEVWHIGDSLAEDYQGAISAGLTAFWVKRKQPLLIETAASVPFVADLLALLPTPPKQGYPQNQRRQENNG